MKRMLLVAGLVSLLALPAMADITASHTGSAQLIAAGRDDVIWDNIPNGYLGTNLISSQHAPNYPFRSGTADDFMIDGSGPARITDVHWWGGYWNGDPPPSTPDFMINFYADVSGKPAGGPGDPTPAALYSYTIPGTDITAAPAGLLESYECDLPTPADVTAGTKYWVEILAVTDFPPQWGIADAGNNQQLDGAHQGFPELQMPFWTPYDPYPTDVSFRLTGYLVPEPASLALLGLAGLFLRRR